MARDYPSGTSDEQTQLIGYLDYYRQTIVFKGEGLSEEQVRWKPAPTSNSLLNLIVHLTGVERRWSEEVIAGGSIDRDRDAEFEPVPDTVTLTKAAADYRTAWNRTNEIVRGMKLDDPCKGEKGFNVRWVVLHLLEETARHAGHADITRELIDGSVGD